MPLPTRTSIEALDLVSRTGNSAPAIESCPVTPILLGRARAATIVGPAPARRPPRTRSATPRCLGVASDGAHDARTAAWSGTASRWRTPTLTIEAALVGRRGGEDRRGSRTRGLRFGAGARRPSSTRGSGRSAALWRARRSARSEPSVVVAARRVSAGEGLHCVAPAGAGRKTVALVASSAEPGARLAAFQYVEEEDSFFWAGLRRAQWASRVTGRCFGHERPRALRGVAVRRRGWAIRRAPGDGGERRRGDVRLSARKKQNRGARSASPPRLRSRARSSRRQTRGFFFRLFRKRKRVLDDAHERCITTSGPVVFADARETRVRLRRPCGPRRAGRRRRARRRRTRPPPCWFPRPKDARGFFGVLGGAHVPAAAGAHVWLAGAPCSRAAAAGRGPGRTPGSAGGTAAT